MSDLVLPSLDAGVRAVPLQGAGGGLYAVVDLVDFEFAMQWRWKAIRSKGRKVKWYAFRTTRLAGRHVAYFLHKEICLRAHGLPPTKDHLIGDHLDGDSLNCRRLNLQWATSSQNSSNRGGIAYQQLRLAIGTGDMSRVQRGRRRAEL